MASSGAPPKIVACMSLMRCGIIAVTLRLGVPLKLHAVLNPMMRDDGLSIERGGPVWVCMLPDKGPGARVGASPNQS